MSHSELETALLVAGDAISAGSLGRDLRRFHPGRRGTPERFSFLAGMELNHPPPIQRTVRILYTAELTGFDLRLSEEDQTYLAWVRDVLLLLQALVDSWWGGINPDLRVLFVDGDDGPPLVLLNTMFPGLRIKRPPSLHRAAAALGLGDSELSALAKASHAARHTPAYKVAMEAAQQVRSDTSLRRVMQGERARLIPEFAPRRGIGIREETARVRGLLDSAYSGAGTRVRLAVRALRAYNELVTACLAFILGYAEADVPQAADEVEAEHPITVDIGPRKFLVHLTFSQPRSLATGATFTLRDGGPLDGLYLSAGAGFQLVGDRMIVDRYGFRLQELELAPVVPPFPST